MARERDDTRAVRARAVRLAYGRYRASARKRRTWAAANPGNAAIRAELLAVIERRAGRQIAEGGEILDAGCGTGHWLARLAELRGSSERLHGIDLLEDRVEHARSAVPGAGVVHGDVTAMPYGDDRFDVVLLLTVLSSLPGAAAVDETLGEVRRVLAPGGTVLVYEPRTLTANRATRRIRPSAVAATLGPPEALETLTLLPPLARRLGSRTDALYPRAAALPPLRTHWLGAFGDRAGSTRG